MRFERAMNYLAGRTVMNPNKEVCRDTGPGEHDTDVRFIYREVIGGNSDIRGRTSCTKWENSAQRICESALVEISIHAIFAQATSGENYQVNFAKTIRHEIGHTVGMRHTGTPNACGVGSTPCISGWPRSYRSMRSGPVITDDWYWGYADHHVWHVNNHY